MRKLITNILVWLYIKISKLEKLQNKFNKELEHLKDSNKKRYPIPKNNRSFTRH